MAYGGETVSFVFKENISIVLFFSPKSIPVYHCCSGHLGTLTWGKITEIGLHHLDTVCMENAIFFPHLQLTENRFLYYYLRYFKEVFPAFLLDCYMRIIGRKPM